MIITSHAIISSLGHDMKYIFIYIYMYHRDTVFCNLNVACNVIKNQKKVKALN